MHRRLSLAVLLLSASLCGMEKDKESGRSWREWSVLVALKAKIFGVAVAAAEEHREGLSPDRLDVIASDEKEPTTKRAENMRSYGCGCMGQDVAYPLVGIPTKGCFFPSEQGEGYLY